MNTLGFCFLCTTLASRPLDPCQGDLGKLMWYLIRKGLWTVCGVALSNSSVPHALVGCVAAFDGYLIQVLTKTSDWHRWLTRFLECRRRYGA
ncbi:hypothetical protein N7490_001712 [Penicillium lividum]|nr:hypothetical protein N7490_001712 [Penicillium lividum]